MKTYPMVVRFGGASSQGHIKEMTAAQIGMSEQALDRWALVKAQAFMHDWAAYERRAFRINRELRE